jgi:hypothetical protein
MFMDIGFGILLSVGASWLSEAPLTPALLALGIGSALLPDIDMLWFGIGRLIGSRKADHRSFTHYPLLWVPAVGALYALFGGLVASIVAAGVALHLIHDTVGLGWGIAWLAPFSYKKYRLLPVPAGDGRWIRAHYLRPGIIAYLEYGTLLAALACLYSYAL